MPYEVSAAQQLRQVPPVDQWYRSLEGSTGVPPEDYLERLHHFARRTDTRPEELARMADPHRQRLLERFRQEEEALGRDAHRVLVAVRSWVGFTQERRPG